MSRPWTFVARRLLAEGLLVDPFCCRALDLVWETDNARRSAHWVWSWPVPDANGACFECRVRACWMQTAPALDATGVCLGCRWRLSWRQSSPVLDADSVCASVAHKSCSRASCSRLQSSPISLGAQDANDRGRALALVCVGMSIGHILAGRDVVWFIDNEAVASAVIRDARRCEKSQPY